MRKGKVVGGHGGRRHDAASPPPVLRKAGVWEEMGEGERAWWRSYGKMPPEVVEYGPLRRWGRWWVVTFYRRTVRVYESNWKGTMLRGPLVEAAAESFTEAYVGGVGMASKWIAAAVTAASKVTTVRAVDEPVLFAKRPALRDFMCELEAEKGKPREPSVLMVCVSADGMRVGLKDDQAGGWLWREASTLEGCLDAIEKALQSGNVQWAVPGGRNGRKR